jgi:quercetin dioxygenase-like cupin family protein
MKVVRMIPGPGDQSIMVDIDLPTPDIFKGSMTRALKARDVQFFVHPHGMVLDWHGVTSPRFLIVLNGLLEIELGDGAKRRFGPGEFFLAEDMRGPGHISRNVGDGPLTVITLQLTEFPFPAV